jgi:hypothetical protein
LTPFHQNIPRDVGYKILAESGEQVELVGSWETRNEIECWCINLPGTHTRLVAVKVSLSFLFCFCYGLKWQVVVFLSPVIRVY